MVLCPKKPQLLPAIGQTMKDSNKKVIRVMEQTNL